MLHPHQNQSLGTVLNIHLFLLLASQKSKFVVIFFTYFLSVASRRDRQLHGEDALGTPLAGAAASMPPAGVNPLNAALV